MAVKKNSILKHMGGRIVDAVFPRFCVRCEKEGSLLCGRCFADWEPGEVQVDGDVVSLFPYADAVTRELIRTWKYHFDQTAWEQLQRKMQPRLHMLSLMARAREAQAVVPIPLHEGRLCARGFDQAEVFAQYISDEIGVPMMKLLYRLQATEKQSDKSETERKLAMEQSPFLAIEEVPSSVLLVDDVYTTGATSAAAIDTLKQAGAERVFVCTIARG